MKIHYFYSLKNHNFHDLYMEAYLEQDEYSLNGTKRKSFQLLERLRLFICKPGQNSHSVDFRIDFGKDSCEGSGCKSLKELYKEKREDRFSPFKPITRTQYERLRKVALAIYHRDQCMDFDLIPKGEQTYTIRCLTS